MRKTIFLMAGEALSSGGWPAGNEAVMRQKTTMPAEWRICGRDASRKRLRTGGRCGIFLFFWIALFAGAAQPPAWGQEMTSLQVALGDVDFPKVPVMVAKDQGIFERNGLDVNVFITPGAAEFARRSGVRVPPQYIQEAEAPIRISGGTPLIVSRITDVRSWDRIILATLDPVVHWEIIARPGITRLEELKGKRLGYSGTGSVTHFIALNVCKRMGWDPVFDISLMAGALVLEALETGRVDAIVADSTHGTMARAAGYKAIADLRSWNLPVGGAGIQTTATWVRENRETARRFVRSLVEAIALLKKNPETAFQAMAKWWGVTDREKLRAMYADAEFMPRKPYPSLEGIRKTMEIYDSHEMRRHKPEDFYDDSFIRELDESGFLDSLYQD